ncbi:IS200/IS605 family transposase [Faecalimonas sp.]
MSKKEYSLAHTKWMCKYHIIFTPKYRRKVIYNQYKVNIRDIIKQLCSYNKGVEIIEDHLMPNHIHMLVSIPLKITEGYYVSTVGLNEATIKNIFKKQEKHDIAMDKLSAKKYEDPF